MSSQNAAFLKEFFCCASLNMLGMAGLSCYILADTFFVARGLGPTGLAALNLAIPLYSLIHGCGLMLGMGGAIRYSILKGQGDTRQGSSLFSSLAGLAGLLALLFVGAGACFSRPLAALMGADGPVFEMTRVYLQVLLLFSPAFLANDLTLCFVRSDGAPRLATLAMLASSFSNILLDVLFIFGLGWGMFGAVFATGLAPLFSLGLLALHWRKGCSGFHLEKRQPRLKAGLGVLGLGLPSLVTELSSGAVIIAFNFLFLRLQGSVGVAAYGVVTNLSLVVIALFNGLAQGVQPLISRACGQNQMPLARRGLRYGLTGVLGLALLIYTLIFVFAAPLAEAFDSQGDALLQSLARQGLRLYFTGIGFAGLNILLCTFFASVGRALPAQLISWGRGFFLILPVAFLAAALGGTVGLWLAFPVAELLVSLMAWALYRAQGDGKRPS